MDALEQQRFMIARLERLRAERDAIDRQITEAATALHRFEKERGNLIAKAERRARWEAMQPTLEARRATAEWQSWRQEFMACRAKARA